MQTVEKLKAAGHEMVLFKLPEPEKAASLFFRRLMPNGRKELLQLYSNEIIPPSFRVLIFYLKV